MKPKRQQPCSHMERVYKRAFELAIKRIEYNGYCISNRDKCEKVMLCLDCIREFYLQAAEVEDQ